MTTIRFLNHDLSRPSEVEAAKALIRDYHQASAQSSVVPDPEFHKQIAGLKDKIADLAGLLLQTANDGKAIDPGKISLLKAAEEVFYGAKAPGRTTSTFHMANVGKGIAGGTNAPALYMKVKRAAGLDQIEKRSSSVDISVAGYSFGDAAPW